MKSSAWLRLMCGAVTALGACAPAFRPTYEHAVPARAIPFLRAAVLGAPRFDGFAVRCVAFRDSVSSGWDPSADEWAQLALPAPLVPIAKCPHTYQRMARIVDSAGRPAGRAPAGYVDPVRLYLWIPPAVVSDTIVIPFEEWQGTGGRGGECTVVREAGGAFTANCRADGRDLVT